MEKIDLEKALDVYDDREYFECRENATESIINPKESSRAMAQVENARLGQAYDLEKQEETANSHPISPDATRESGGGLIPNKNASTSVQDLDPAAKRLARDLKPLSVDDFYTLMGLRTPTTPSDGAQQLAQPNGLYSNIYKQMRYNNRKFKVFDIAAYALLFVQIVISAVFIILGSLRNVDTHITIAVLGAVATVIAGTLALMKGQGLPNRLRQTRDSLRDVMFTAEELYWDIRSGRPVLYKDIKKIRESYLRCLLQARQNHPDVWTGEAEEIATGGRNDGTTKSSRNL